MAGSVLRDTRCGHAALAPPLLMCAAILNAHVIDFEVINHCLLKYADPELFCASDGDCLWSCVSVPHPGDAVGLGMQLLA